MDRRTFLLMATASLAIGPRGRVEARPGLDDNRLKAIQRDWAALLAPNADVVLSTEPLRRSKEEWQHALTGIQYAILRDAGTEPPGSSSLNGEKRPGVFVCVGCSLPLFTSRMKFESGTGWPSFFTSIPDHLKVKSDFKLETPRIEYHCVRCGGHQGHLFPDGPPPTGERWCNNGIALRFIPA